MHRLEKELLEMMKNEHDIFQFIEQSTLDGLWFWDLESPEHEWMSDTFWRTLGYDPDTKAHLASEWQDIIHPEDLKNAVSNFQKHCIDESVPYDQIVRYQHKNGSTVWIRCRGFAIRNKEGKAIRMFGAHTDITEVKKQEEKRVSIEQEKNARLKELQQRYNELIQNAPGVFFQYSITSTGVTKIRYVTQGSTDIWGMTPDEIGTDPTPLWAMIHKDDVQGMAEAIETSRETLTPWEYEWRICLPSGEEKWLQGKSTPRVIDHGDTIFNTLVMDVTERISLQEKLSHSEKMEAIGQLASGVAHDFNNQLAGISGYAELLQKEQLSTQAQGYLSKIIAAVQRSSALTRQMLDYSSQQHQRNEYIQLHNELEDTIEFLTHSIDKRITIKAHYNANLCTVKGDASKLQNAFLNIAINSADAMTTGGKLTISTKKVTPKSDVILSNQRSASAKEYIRVVFEDNGSGIDKKNLSRVFDPFFTTKEVGSGVGMGLASVYGVIKQHDGFSYIDSELGKGTKVYLYLPLAEEIYANEVKEDNRKHQQHQVSKTILVVDDEETLREICRDFLLASGYQVLLASNGKDGVELYRQHHNDIDVVLMDMEMPLMNGYDASSAIKAINPNATIVIASGYSNHSSADLMNIQNIAAFIEKPYKLHDLITTLAQVTS